MNAEQNSAAAPAASPSDELVAAMKAILPMKTTDAYRLYYTLAAHQPPASDGAIDIEIRLVRDPVTGAPKKFDVSPASDKFCRFPLCQSEAEQDKIAAQVNAALGEPPASDGDVPMPSYAQILESAARNGVHCFTQAHIESVLAFAHDILNRYGDARAIDAAIATKEQA